MPRTRLLALPLLIALLAAGCGSDDDGGGAAKDGGTTAKGATTIEVTLTDAGCEPHDISAKAGPTTFHVTNEDSAAVTEFEVLERDDKILGEVENISAGLDRSFSLNLKPGSYKTKCTNGTKELGTLEVAKAGTGRARPSSAAARIRNFFMPISNRKAALIVPSSGADRSAAD